MTDHIQAPGSEYVRPITGAGGGKGGAHTPIDAANTLRSSAVARIVEVVSEGTIEGLAGGARGVYLNDVPLQNADGTTNFPRSTWDYRVGLPSQDYMPGFPNVSSEFSVNTAVTIATNNIVRTMTASCDVAMVTIGLPSGLSYQNPTNGDITGSSVQFGIYTRPTGGTYTLFGTFTITGKTMDPYEASYRVPRQTTSGAWDIKVTRVTADPDSYTHNLTNWNRYTEIQEIAVSYPNAAVVGLAVDAESVGNAIPKRSYLVKGKLVQIPSNYTPATRTYTGTWNGLFTTSTVAVSNPCWALFDVLTNTLYGAGIDPNLIDKNSFYSASQYCDTSVTYTGSTGLSATEPRFTFDMVVNSRPDFWTVIKTICGSMNAQLIWWNGKWTLIQDRPASVFKLISKANVINGYFKYSSTGLYERHTAVNVTYNDKTDRYLQRTVTVEDSAGIARYGYNTIDIAAYGATTEGQAIRAGKWLLYTELNQTSVVEFDMGLNGFDLTPGDIVSVFDEDYAGQTGGGRVVSYTAGTTSVVLDRTVPLVAGCSITALLADGVTTQTKTISTTTSASTITISSAFSTALFPNADFQITYPTVAPRQFKVLDVTFPATGNAQVKCVNYDPNKYTSVESGVTVPGSSFLNYYRTVIPAPTGLTFQLSGRVNASGVPERDLLVYWTAPATDLPVKGYTITWARDSGNRQSMTTNTTTCAIPADTDGTYNVSVFSSDFNGNTSGTSLNDSYVVTSNGLTVDTTGFGAVINLVAVDSNGTTWQQDDLIVRWADNTSNTRPAQDYKVDVYTSDGVTLLRSTVVPIGLKTYNYDIASNRTDGSGVPRASVMIKVTARDAMNAYSPTNSVVFTNPAPVAVTGFGSTGMYKGNLLKWTANTEADVQGYYVWRGTTSGFSPSSASLVYNGLGTTFLDGPLTDTTTYYYKIAAYDNFTNSTAGAGLNVVATSSTTTKTPGIVGSSTAPTGAAAGDFYFNTTDNLLYRYDGTQWRVTGMYQGTTTQMNAKTGMVTGDLWSNTTDGKLYRYNGSAWTAAVPAVDITGSLSDSQIAALSAAKLTGQITSTQITDGAISTPKLAAGSVTSATIAANTIVAGNIAASTITGGQIAAFSIAGNNIAANTITSGNIATGTITANEIAASTITGGKIAANTISTSNIQAGAITAASGIIGDLAVTSLKIANNAVSSVAISGGSGTNTPLNFNVPANCAALVLTAYFGTSAHNEYVGGDKGSATTVTTMVPSLGTITANGSVQQTNRGSASVAFLNPAPGAYTTSASRSGSDTGAYGGMLVITAQIQYK